MAPAGVLSVRHVGDEIASHGFETALLAHVGNENREQAVGDLPDADVQVQRVLRQRLACFNAFAFRIHHARVRAVMQGDRQLAFAHHAIRGHQFHDVAELRERHHLAVDDAEATRFGRRVSDRSQRIDDDQGLGHDGHQLAFRGLHRHARAEQRRVLRGSEQARIIRIDAVLGGPDALYAADGVCHNGHDHGDSHQHGGHLRSRQHLAQRHEFTFRSSCIPHPD